MSNTGAISSTMRLRISLLSYLLICIAAFQPNQTPCCFSIRTHTTSPSDVSYICRSMVDDEEEAISPRAEPNNALELLDLFSPDPACDTTRMSGTDLAYIGDVVFEIYTRSRYVWPSKRTSELQKAVVERVRGE